MKKAEKGTSGYIDQQKKKYLMFAIGEFAIVFAVLFIGIWQTKTRLNAMTVVAVVGCLPASKMLVEYLVMAKFHSVKESVQKDVERLATNLTKVYDLLVSHPDKLLDVDTLVIRSEKIPGDITGDVCGYTDHKDTDTKKAEAQIRKILATEGFDQMAVHVFTDYKKFLARVEKLNDDAASKDKRDKYAEEEMKRIILTTCM